MMMRMKQITSDDVDDETDNNVMMMKQITM
jgi:hypothetical protein